MNFLIFQHIACEHPGVFRKFLKQDGITSTAIQLDEGEPIPDISNYDALWVMGGPMDVWQEKQHPWLVDEKAAIKHAVLNKKLPYLGLCLGHQLLAETLGGKVEPSAQPEIGIMEVGLNQQGLDSPFLKGLGAMQLCLQWHSAEITKVPSGADVLASSAKCQVQAMSIGSHALSLQYHVELEHDTVPNWGDIPAYKSALETAAGQGALDDFKLKAAQNMDSFNATAKILYDNFMSTTGLKEY